MAKREAALQKLRDQLTGPQPDRKVLRRPWRHVTNLEPGMVLAYTGSSGAMALFRILGVEDSRDAVSPVVERLDWRGHQAPSPRKLRRLKASRVAFDDMPARDERYVVSRMRKKDLDWDTAGFTVIDTQPCEATTSGMRGTLYTQWSSLVTLLERELDRPD